MIFASHNWAGGQRSLSLEHLRGAARYREDVYFVDVAGHEGQSVLRAQIATYLRSNPRSTAAELAGALGVSKKRVNAQLYRHDEFQSDSATPPRWNLRASATTARPPKKPAVKKAASKKVVAKRAATRTLSAKRTAPKKPVAKRAAPKKAPVKRAALARGTHEVQPEGLHEVPLHEYYALRAAVVRGRRKGLPLQELQLRFGLSRESVVHLLRLDPRTSRLADQEEFEAEVQPDEADRTSRETSLADTASPIFERIVVRSRLNGSSIRDLVVEFGLLREEVLQILARDERTRPASRKSKFVERNAEIVERCLAGATVEELVEDFSLSKLRIAQILKTDPRTSTLVRERKLQQRNTAIIEGCLAGAQVADLAREFSLTQKRVRGVLESDERTRGLKAAKRPLSVRDEQMIAMRVDGHTLQEIAERFNLTRERVRQILIRHEHEIQEAAQSRQQDLIESVSAGLAEGKSISNIAKSLGVPIGQVESLLKSRTDDDKTATGQLRSRTVDLAAQRVKAFLCENPGLTLREVAEASGYSTSFIRRAAPSLSRRLTVLAESDGRAGSKKVWADEQILDVIRLAATYEYPITTKHFEHLRSIGEISAPSVPLVHMRFGGWRAACEAAGVEPGETLRHSYESRWTDADLLRFAGQFLADESSDGTFNGFEKWLAQDDDRPSGATVRNRLGGWLDIKLAALTADWFKGMLREQR